MKTGGLFFVVVQNPEPGSTSSLASISHRLRRTHSGHSARRRLFASGISCHPRGINPFRFAAEEPHEEQNTLLRSSPDMSLIG